MQAGMALGATQGDENRIGERFVLSPVSESRPGARMYLLCYEFSGQIIANGETRYAHAKKQG